MEPKRELVLFYTGNTLKFIVHSEEDVQEWKKFLNAALDRLARGEGITRADSGGTTFIVSPALVGYQVRDYQPDKSQEEKQAYEQRMAEWREATKRSAEMQERMAKILERQLDPDSNEPWKRGDQDDS